MRLSVLECSFHCPKGQHKLYKSLFSTTKLMYFNVLTWSDPKHKKNVFFKQTRDIPRHSFPEKDKVTVSPETHNALRYYRKMLLSIYDQIIPVQRSPKGVWQKILQKTAIRNSGKSQNEIGYLGFSNINKRFEDSTWEQD